MSRIVKRGRMITVLVVVLCLLLATACTPKPTDGLPDGTPNGTPNGLPNENNVSSPVVISYLTKNPLEIITAEETEGDNYQRTITVEGLTDKDVQAAINNRLGEIYVNILEGELPPYRGIRQKITGNSVVMNSNLDASMSFDYNNVASVLIYGNKTYVKQDENGIASQKQEKSNNMINVGTMEAYNVDLNTGEQITLKDVFADDVDYKEILNDYIGSMLLKSNAGEEQDDYFSMSSNLKLVSPFKGISDNQKFFIFGGGLGLIFDYSNPEFDINLYPITIYISFKELGNVVAVTERFYDQSADLYESNDSPVYEFVQTWGVDHFREQKNEMAGNVNIYRSLTYSKDIPKIAQEKVKSLYTIDEKRLDEINKLTDPTLEMWSSLEYYVWTTISGEYTTVTRNMNVSYNGQWKMETENYCYDAEGNLIGLADIFVSDFDYKSSIMNGLTKALKEMPTLGDYDVNQLYNELQFSIGLAEISFTTIPVQFDLASKNPVYFSLTFEEIGCENLTIFH